MKAPKAAAISTRQVAKLLERIRRLRDVGVADNLIARTRPEDVTGLVTGAIAAA